MTLRLRWLGHASTVLDVDGVRLLTDPLLLRHAGLLRRRGAAPRPADWQGADASCSRTCTTTTPSSARCALLGRRPGADRARERPLAAQPGHRRGRRAHGRAVVARCPGSDVRRAAGAARCTSTGRCRTGRTRRTGSSSRRESFRIWFAGDTAPFAAMADLPALAGGPIDLALVPVGGWGPRLSGRAHGRGPGRAGRARASARGRAVPVHWGTLHAPVSRRLPPGWMDRAGPAFAHAAARVAPSVQVHVVEPGEQIELVPPTR